MQINGAGPSAIPTRIGSPQRIESDSPVRGAGPHRSQAAASSLQDVLTDEERAYFAQLESLGPVTYGPRARAAGVPTAPVGQRIDVRA
jgi:hypothetical protein